MTVPKRVLIGTGVFVLVVCAVSIGIVIATAATVTDEFGKLTRAR